MIPDLLNFLLKGVVLPLTIGWVFSRLAVTRGWRRPRLTAFVASLLLMSVVFGVHDFIAYGREDADRLHRAFTSVLQYLPSTLGLSFLAFIPHSMYLGRRARSAPAG